MPGRHGKRRSAGSGAGLPRKRCLTGMGTTEQGRKRRIRCLAGIGRDRAAQPPLGHYASAMELNVLRVFLGPDGGGGNLLGVFLDGTSIESGRRHAVAAELGFSETVFVDEGHDASA